jgi:hypothetical protein
MGQTERIGDVDVFTSFQTDHYGKLKVDELKMAIWPRLSWHDGHFLSFRRCNDFLV